MENEDRRAEGKPEPRSSKLWLTVAVLVVVVLVAMHLHLGHKFQSLAQRQAATEQRVAALDAQLKATSAALESEQKRVTASSQQLSQAQHRATAAENDRIRRVNNQMDGMATEVGDVKRDIASTRSDLDAARARLERAIGDLGVQSGLIARTHDELQTLEKRGDRNYYEFTLLKGKHPTPVSTVSLQLKKVDSKHNKFTLNVLADDKTIEKKDRNIFEPLQFYTGKDHYLYELVVNDVEKNKISGYIATPKDAPQPVAQ